MLGAFSKIGGADVDDRTANGFGGCNDDVVVLRDLEGVEGFLSSGFIQNTSIDRVWDGIVDEF